MPNSKPSLLLEWLLAVALRRPVRPLLAYAIATAVVLGVGVVRALFITSLLPYLFYIPAVLGLALVLGKGPGLYASALAALVAAFTLGTSAEPGWLTGPQWVSTGLFLAITAGMVVVIAELRVVFARAARVTLERDESFERLAEREGFLSSVLASSPDCIKVLDLDGKLTFMSEGGQDVMEVSDFNAIRGCPWPDFWAGEGNVEAKAALVAARAGETRQFIGKADTMRGTPKWWSVAVSPILGANGRPERILSVSRDITAQRRSDDERQRLAHLVEASTDAIAMHYLDGTVFFLNEAARRLLSVEERAVETLNVADFFAPAEAARVTAHALAAVDASRPWTGEANFRDFRTGEAVPVLYTVFPVLANGERVGFAGVARDNRERKRADAQQALLNNELSHRMKNLMTLVQAMADQTLRAIPDRSPVENFTKRLQALSTAHVLLLGQNWQAARVMAVVTSALEAFGHIERFEANGPDVALGPRATVSLSLLIHELATNALKYGALSNDAGRVTIAWAVEQGEDGDALVVRWREHGGPPAQKPTRKSFGSRLIRAGLIGTGGAELRYEPGGLEADFTASLAHMQDR